MSEESREEVREGEQEKEEKDCLWQKAVFFTR